MAIRKLVLLVALSLLALPSFVIADHEHRVTVQMRNGDRVSGPLEDVENGRVYVRRQSTRSAAAAGWRCAGDRLRRRRIRLPDTELSVAAKPDHLVVLRNGSSWTGRFVDVHGGEATAAPGETHTLIFRDGNEERAFSIKSAASTLAITRTSQPPRRSRRTSRLARFVFLATLLGCPPASLSVAAIG